MKRIFCDRCGEEIDYRGRSKQVDIVGTGVGTYDMCPQCMVEFRKQVNMATRIRRRRWHVYAVLALKNKEKRRKMNQINYEINQGTYRNYFREQEWMDKGT